MERIMENEVATGNFEVRRGYLVNMVAFNILGTDKGTIAFDNPL